MKSIKELREQYQVITEKEDKEQRKLTALVRAGLFDAKKLPMLKRALEKGVDKMTPAEKKILIDLLDSLMNQVVSNEPVYMKVKRNVQSVDEEIIAEAVKKPLTVTDIPTIVILKRKAVRVYPGGHQVGLYYSQQIDKYVTIPFGEAGISDLSEDTIDEATPPNLRTRNRPLYIPYRRDEIDRDIEKDYDTLSSQKRKRLTPKTVAARGFRDDGVRGAIVGGTLAYLLPKMKKRRLLNLKKSRRQIPESYELDENLGKLVTAIPSLVKGVSQVASKSKSAVSGAISKYMAKRAARKKALERLNRMKSKNKNAKGSRRSRRGDLIDLDYNAGGNSPAGSSSTGSQSYKKAIESPFTSQLKPNLSGPQYRVGTDAPNDPATARRLQKQFYSQQQQQNESTKVDLDGNLFEINNNIAEKLINVYESLNNNNKQKMVDMLMNEETQNKILEFVRRY